MTTFHIYSFMHVWYDLAEGCLSKFCDVCMSILFHLFWYVGVVLFSLSFKHCEDKRLVMLDPEIWDGTYFENSYHQILFKIFPFLSLWNELLLHPFGTSSLLLQLPEYEWIVYWTVFHTFIIQHWRLSRMLLIYHLYFTCYGNLLANKISTGESGN